MSKPIEFPPQYNWLTNRDQAAEPIDMTATVARDINRFMLNADDAFRHLTRQCKKGWLVFSTVVWSEFGITVHSLDDDPDLIEAMVAASKVMPALNDSRSRHVHPFLYRPGEELLHINELSIGKPVPVPPFPEAMKGFCPERSGKVYPLILAGQTTSYTLFEADCQAYRYLRPSEEIMIQQLLSLLSPAARNADALDRMQQLIGRNEWNADLFQPISDLLAKTGRSVQPFESAGD